MKNSTFPRSWTRPSSGDEYRGQTLGWDKRNHIYIYNKFVVNHIKTLILCLLLLLFFNALHLYIYICIYIIIYIYVMYNV